MLSLVFVAIAISSVSWLLVLSPNKRRRFGTWRFLSRMNEEEREMHDAWRLAGLLITAVTSTTFLLFVLLASIVKLFR